MAVHASTMVLHSTTRLQSGKPVRPIGPRHGSQQAVAAAVERAAATSEAEREAAVAKKSAADAGIVHVHVKKVESHGKARATDGESNVVTFTIRDAIESGAL